MIMIKIVFLPLLGAIQLKAKTQRNVILLVVPQDFHFIMMVLSFVVMIAKQIIQIIISTFKVNILVTLLVQVFHLYQAAKFIKIIIYVQMPHALYIIQQLLVEL